MVTRKDDPYARPHCTIEDPHHAIEKELTTVRFALADIATLPVIEAESRLHTIEQKTR